MTGDTPAEVILKQLGITEPREIDLEAIAWHLGARVRYRPLDGCEGTDPRFRRSRCYHCQFAQQPSAQALLDRARARSLASPSRPDALLPEGGYRTSGFSQLEPRTRGRRICEQPADAGIPLLANRPALRTHRLWGSRRNRRRVRHQQNGNRESGWSRQKYFVGCLVCHGLRGRKWFTLSSEVPDRWFPCQDLSSDSFAFNILFGSAPEDLFPRKVGADAWFDCWGADRYEVYEQTIRVGDGEILTLLRMDDPGMLQ